MSKATVHESLKLPAARRNELSAAILAALIKLYGAEIRRILIEQGYGNHELSVNDPDVIARLAKKASEQALTIVLFSNQLLKGAIDALSETLTDEQLLTALQPFFDQRTQYNAGTLVPHLAQWARQQATYDWFRENGLDLTWECYPGYTDSTDTECNCPDAIATSPMSYEEAQGFTMPDHPNCLVSGTVVFGPSAQKSFARPYQGPIITIRTASGNELTGTPNHPVLTGEGWVGLGSLYEGQNIVRCVDPERMSALVNPNNHDIPTRIEEALHSDAMRLVQMPSSSKDFHGDGVSDAYVDVIFPDRSFKNDRLCRLCLKPRRERSLMLARVNATPLVRLGAGYQRLRRVLHSSTGAVSGTYRLLNASYFYAAMLQPAAQSSYRDAAFSSKLFKRGPLEVARRKSFQIGDVNHIWPMSARSSGALQPLPHSDVTEASALRERLNSFSSLIARDKVIEVRYGSGICHVYNLSTSEGWYSANGIIVSNCFHEMRPIIPADLLLPDHPWDGTIADSETEAA